MSNNEDRGKVVALEQKRQAGAKRARRRPGGGDKAGAAGDRDSRQAILEAAARIMATKGFSGASISMICRAAGLPASSLYWHFDSKENLFAEVVQWKADFFFSQFRTESGELRYPTDTVDGLAELVGGALQDDPLFLRFLLLLGLERKDMPEEARKVIVEVRNLARQWWQGLLEAQFADRGRTIARLISEDYADFCRALIDGAFFAWDFGDGADLRKVFRQLMVLLSALDEKIQHEEAGRQGGAGK